MSEKKISTFRDFPSVEEILQSPKLAGSIKELPRPIIADTVKHTIAEQKKLLKEKSLTESSLIKTILSELATLKQKEITKVINATGIIVHTNLGRAPLSEELFDDIKKTVTGYGNVEFDLTTGKRGKRGEAAEQYLATLTGAEAGTIVNNCAAALFLTLNSFANRKEVIISRSELVQIGGGFRIPDILKKSGAKLKEIGTTNITTLQDYEQALTDKTGMLLKVHQSNFVQRGFVEETKLTELVALSKTSGVPLLNDLGSGVFVPTKPLLGYKEPTVQDSVRAKADLTCFSGDKMLGGAQAGLIVGKKAAIDKIKKNPIYRAMRVDKIIYSMLEKLLAAYLNGTHTDYIKLWSAIKTPEAELYKRGKALLKSLGNPDAISVAATSAYLGGGALPDSAIPSVGIIFDPVLKATRLLKLFRQQPLPIIGRIEDETFILDLKVVDQADQAYLEKTIRKVLKQCS